MRLSQLASTIYDGVVEAFFRRTILPPCPVPAVRFFNHIGAACAKQLRTW